MAAQDVTELIVYKKSYEQAMKFYEISKGFPAEEKFALISQGRRSSRSVSMNLREAWAKRRYEAHFVSKLTDCDAENAETATSLEFAKDCGYIDSSIYAELAFSNREIGCMLGHMINHPHKFLLGGGNANKVKEPEAVYTHDATDPCLLTPEPCEPTRGGA